MQEETHLLKWLELFFLFFFLIYFFFMFSVEKNIGKLSFSWYCSLTLWSVILNALLDVSKWVAFSQLMTWTVIIKLLFFFHNIVGFPPSDNDSAKDDVNYSYFILTRKNKENINRILMFRKIYFMIYICWRIIKSC